VDAEGYSLHGNHKVVIAENKAGKKALQAHFNFNADIP
jgi:hypothetical protein